MARAWVYARTSGDEADTGQDVGAQADDVAATMRRLDHEVVGRSVDDGVSGTSNPDTREGLREALVAVRGGQADFVAVAEASRLSRQHPARALAWFDEMAADDESPVRFVCVRDAAFTTWGKDLALEDDTQVVVRFFVFWKAWSERRTLVARTQATMTAFKEGRRQPKAKIGRPGKDLSEAELSFARAEHAKGKSPGKISVALSQGRGAHLTPDAKLQRERTVSRSTVARALGLPGYGGAE